MINISSHHRKEYWKRRVAPDAEVRPPVCSQYYIEPIQPFGERFQLLTQSDLLREIEASAHDINGQYQSTRPIKEIVEREIEVTHADGSKSIEKRKDWEIVGFDDLETARFGYQKRFAVTKAAHAAGDGFSINNEQLDKSEEAHRRFDNLNSWKDMAGLDVALMEIHLSCNQTGDAGLYQFVTPSGNIEYKVYSFLDGYEICPDIDEAGNPIYYVFYSLKGRAMCDVFSTEFVRTWIQGKIDGAGDASGDSWWGRVKGLFKSRGSNIVGQRSEDGWTCVCDKVRQIGSGIGQFSYFRVRDIPSGASQLDIEAAERAASFVLEGVKSTTFDTLFIKATDIENLPPVGSHGNVLAVKGDVESLKASDAKRLAPSDVSNVATIALKELKESILHSTMSVIVGPDILRSGADSSSAMRLCFNDEVKYAMAMQPYFYKPLRHAVEVLKNLVAKIEEDPAYASLRVSVTQNIWVPSNFSESVDNVTKLKYAGMISAENGRHELDLNYPDDMAIVRREADEELYQKTFIPLKAKNDAEREFGIIDIADDIVVGENGSSSDDSDFNMDNPYKPGVDNGSPGVTNQASRRPDVR